jgi:hypothetical protein
VSRWAWSKVAVACGAYALAVVGVSLWRLTAWAQAEARRSGMADGELYALLPRPRAWWVALLRVPPATLVAWWAHAQRG